MYFAWGIETFTVIVRDGSKPDSTCKRVTKLRSRRPAPTSSTRASAISTITNALRTLAPRAADPERPPSFSVSVSLAPAEVSAGAMPKMNALTSAAAIVNSSTLLSMPTCSSR